MDERLTNGQKGGAVQFCFLTSNWRIYDIEAGYLPTIVELMAMDPQLTEDMAKGVQVAIKTEKLERGKMTGKLTNGQKIELMRLACGLPEAPGDNFETRYKKMIGLVTGGKVSESSIREQLNNLRSYLEDVTAASGRARVNTKYDFHAGGHKAYADVLGKTVTILQGLSE